MAGGNHIVGNVLDHRFVSTTEGDRIVKIATDHRSVNTIERDTVVKTVVGQVSVCIIYRGKVVKYVGAKLYPVVNKNEMMMVNPLRTIISQYILRCKTR
jgi:hypothetical protein